MESIATSAAISHGLDRKVIVGRGLTALVTLFMTFDGVTSSSSNSTSSKRRHSSDSHRSCRCRSGSSCSRALPSMRFRAQLFSERSCSPGGLEERAPRKSDSKTPPFSSLSSWASSSGSASIYAAPPCASSPPSLANNVVKAQSGQSHNARVLPTCSGTPTPFRRVAITRHMSPSLVDDVFSA
jgi:hypothetical protein